MHLQCDYKIIFTNLSALMRANFFNNFCTAPDIASFPPTQCNVEALSYVGGYNLIPEPLEVKVVVSDHG